MSQNVMPNGRKGEEEKGLLKDIASPEGRQAKKQ
jgi:hypothetical protein